MDTPRAAPPSAADAPQPPHPGSTVFNAAQVARLIGSACGHNGFLGIRYHDHGADWCELALPWRADLVGVEETGVLASGPIVSLLDNATSLSVWVRSGVFSPQVTLDLRIDYVRAAISGRTVVAHAECYQLRRNVAFVRGTAHDGDPADPVAHAAGTFMLVQADERARA